MSLLIRHFKTQQSFILTVTIISILLVVSKTLGEVFLHPQSDQLQIIRVRQALYFSQNNTLTLPYSRTKSRQPNSLITYDNISSNHYSLASPQFVSWFNIRSLNVTLSSLVVYSQSTNEQNSSLEYHTFSIMISCVDTRYLQIINWEYTGPRMIADVTNFFNISILPFPDPFGYCYTDSTHTVKQNVNFMLNYNGVVGANWLAINRDVSKHSSKLTFHIYPTYKTNFTIYLYSDHRSWVDKYYLGLLFVCPNSYLLKRKYFAEMQIVSIGGQFACQSLSNYQTQYLTLQKDYSYLELIGTRFVSPNLDKPTGFTFDFQFSLDSSINASRRYYQAWKICGQIDYNVLFIVQKFCDGNRTFIQSNGSCICNNSLKFYDIGVVDCDFVCPIPLVEINFQCKTCLDLYGVGCVSCDNLTCNGCDTNFLSVNNSCKCSSDRAIFNLTQCLLCNTIYGQFCSICDNVSCLGCEVNFQLQNGTCKCEVDHFLIGSQCFLCEDMYGPGCIQCDQLQCIICKTNWTQLPDSTCACLSPNYIQPNTASCLLYQEPYISPRINKTQTLSISQQHIQIGRVLFIQLKFNHQFNQMTEVIPLQSNLKIIQGQSQIHEIKWHKDMLLLQIQLLQLNYNHTLIIEVINQQYLKWQSLALENQLSPITIQSTQSSQSLGNYILLQLCKIMQWAYLLMILMSWGGLNNGFQLWFVLSSYLYLKTDIYGQTGSALLQISRTQLLQIIPWPDIPYLKIQHHKVQFIEKVLGKNTGIIQATSLLIIVFMFSIFLCLALRHYIISKRPRYIVYINFLKHYKEYIITNFISLYPFLLLPIAVQFQSILKEQSFQKDEVAFVNFIVTCTLVIVMLFTPLIMLYIYPRLTPESQSHQHYSVVYNKLHPSGCLFLIQHFIRILRTPIFVTVIFCTRSCYPLLGELILIFYTLTYLSITAINFNKYLTKLYWVFALMKNLLLLGFQIGFFFLSTTLDSQLGTGIDETFGKNWICLWIVVFIVALELLEVFVKVIRILLANKLNWKQVYVVSLKIQPIERQEICFQNDELVANDGKK